MKFSELWRIARTVYKEVSFQSVFSLRSGGGLPQKGIKNVKQLIRNAAISTLISKSLTSLFIAVFGLTVLLPFAVNSSGPGIPPEPVISSGLSAFLAVILFLIVIMGLQVSTSLVSSKIVEVLCPLPLSRRDVSAIVLLCLLMIFDIPLATAIVAFELAYALAGGSLVGGAVSFLAICITEVFALSLAVGLSRIFYSKIASGGGRSRTKTFLRLVFMIVWILPSFGAYFMMSFGVDLIRSFASFAQFFFSSLQFLVFIYPFSFGFLVSYLTFYYEAGSFGLISIVGSCFGYSALAVYCIRWLIRTLGNIGIAGGASRTRDLVKDTIVKPRTPFIGIIQKDLRMATRVPSLSALFLLPTLQTIALAVSFSSIEAVEISTALGILIGMSIVTMVLPPTLFSIEGIALTYTRSLPLTRRILIFSKTALATLTFIVSLAILFLAATILGRDFTYILIFGGIHSISVAASSMLELTIMANKFWKEGTTIGNLYSKLSTFILIIIPGLALALLPLTVAFSVYMLASEWTLVVFLLLAFLELSATTLLALREKKTK